MQINCFKDFRSKTPVESTFEAVVEKIRSDGRLATITAQYRQSGSKQIKEQSPLFGVAATFAGGKAQKDITALTGLSLVDLDHVDKEKMDGIRKAVSADAHTMLCYTTVSGCGLRIIFAYELDHDYGLRQQLMFYRKAFATGNDYYERLTGIKSDRQCKDVNRLSALAHDPAVFYNPGATPFTAADMVSHGRKDASDGKHLKAHDRIDRYYHDIIVKRLPPGLTFATGSHNEYVMRVGYMLARKRYRESDVLQWAEMEFKDYEDTCQVIRSCFNNVRLNSPDSTPYTGRDSTDDTGGRGQQIPTAGIGDIKAFLSARIQLRFNVVSGRTEYFMAEPDGSDEQWKIFEDRMLNTLWADMATDFKVRKDDINNVVNSDYTPLFNPFMCYFNSLQPWHSGDHDYIADLAATVKIRGESKLDFCEVLRKWMVAMVASWFGKSTVNHVIMVLIGDQGIYKTTWFSHLLPPELRNYFYTKVNVNRTTRDEMVFLSRYALMCYEELDCMSSADLNRLKGIVTMEHVDEREPYARYAEHRPHIASFCGTGNNVQFLTDPTGNRRWMPFEVESLTSPREHPLNYAGIYSQVYALYLSGFRYYFTQEEIKVQNGHNRNFESPNMEMELVSLYFRLPNQGEPPTFMTATRAMQIIGANMAQRLSVVRITKAFKDLGFEPARSRNLRGYWVVERSAEDIRSFLKNITPDT